MGEHVANHATREVLWAAVRRPGVREWMVNLIIGAPAHAAEVEAYIAGGREISRAAMPSCLATYETRATVVPSPDGASGNLIITAETQARDEEIVSRFLAAAVLAATGASTEPPAGRT